MKISPKIPMRFITSAMVLVFAICTFAQEVVDVSGEWNVSLKDSDDPQLKELKGILQGVVLLPGSLAENQIGYKTIGSDYGVLTPEYKFIGKAYYSREIQIPASWKQKEVSLVLERVLWESRVYIDGVELSRQDALGTEHFHELGRILPGTHLLTVMVDNEMIHNIGDKGHAYGEYTQGIWNGIVGKMCLIASDHIRITSAKVIPDIENERINVQYNIRSHKRLKGRLSYQVESVISGEIPVRGELDVKGTKGDNIVTIVIPANGLLNKWSEFHPETYYLKTKFVSGSQSGSHKTEFGYSQVSHNGTNILINGKPVFLRGNIDCVHFPLTGYPSCDLKDWERIFKLYKEYGLNHARFHSWCPPEAAFTAANRLGIYLQAEASIWIDWWMTEDMTAKGRPEMDTRGHPAGLGHDPVRDSFVVAEMNRMVDKYGNHPSFIMFCIGNELGNSDFSVMESWIANLKEKDPRRLYALSTAREITVQDDYSATHYIKGIGGTRGLRGPSTDWDFEDVYGQVGIPVIAHEIGQWPVYPRWKEIEKYSGTMKARNLEEFRVQAEKNGIVSQDHDFALASGALNQIMYKYETESFLRTPSCAGVQLLSMQDYQGQGEALIGWLDAHWDSKGITTPEKFRQHYDATVPLLRFNKYVWTSDETFMANLVVSHFGEAPLIVDLKWTISDQDGNELINGTFVNSFLELGEVTKIGKLRFPLSTVRRPQKLNVKVELEGTIYQNSWDIWVYPSSLPQLPQNDILVTRHLDDTTWRVLEAGGKVLLVANQLGTELTSVNNHFYPLYWSLTFFPGQGKTNIGMHIQSDHPAFNEFPTSYHSDWQWESISNNAKGFVLNDTPSDYRPVAQPVDDFHRNNRMGAIFELKVGRGSLLVSGYDLLADLPAARQLKQSLLTYMMTEDFQPVIEMTKGWIEKEFDYISKAEPADLPEQFDAAILHVSAAENLSEKGKNIPWDPSFDGVRVKKGVEYLVQADGTWRDDQASAWHGKEMEISIDCPSGMLGSLYVHFSDWNENNRTGLLNFEGRRLILGEHAKEGQWIKFHVMREDSNDGKLLLRTDASTGPNLMITKMVLVNE